MIKPVQPIFTQPAATAYVRAAAPAQAGIGAGAATAGTATAGYAVAQKPAADKHQLETTAIKTLQFATILMPVVFLGDLLTRGLGFVTRKGIGLVSPSAGNKVASWIRAPHEALNHTNLNDLGSLGSNFSASKAGIAKDGKLAEDFAGTLVSNTARSQSINAGFTRVAAPVGKPIAGALDALDKTGPMQWITDKITGFASKREANLLSKGKEATRWAGLKNFGGFGGWLKTLPTKIGNARLSSVLGLAGAVAGTGVMLLANHKASREDGEALKAFSADVYGVDESQVTQKMLSGDHAHPLVAEANKIYKSNVHGRHIVDAFGVVGIAATGGNLLSANPSGWLLAADMGIPTLGDKFNHESPALNSYTVLKKAEAGQLALTPEQKMQEVMQLLTTVPAIAHNKGIENDYVPAVAEAIVQKGLTTSQIVHTLADKVAFNTLSSEVIAKVDTEKAIAKQQAAEKAQQSSAAPTMLAAAAPGKQVHNVEHQGMQVHAQHHGRH